MEPKKISAVAGIPADWNKSDYNKKALALEAMSNLCSDINATYILISFNSDGFISLDEMTDMLSKLGNKNLNCAKIVIAIIPLLMIYPLCQRYLISGMVMGSVKE